MSIITNIGKSVRSHLVKELTASDENPSGPDAKATSAAPAAAETGNRRSKGTAGPSKHVAPKGQQGPGSLVLGSDAMDVNSTKAQKKTSKQEIVLGLLRRDDGATIDELIDATAWQAHSVRGFLSGTARKKLKLNLISDVVGNGVRRYRVVPGGGNDAAPEAGESLPSGPLTKHPVTVSTSAEQVG